MMNNNLRFGFFWAVYAKVDITPQKRAQNWLKRTQKSTEAEIVNSPIVI